MPFKFDVQKTKGIGTSYQEGLGALRRVDKKRVSSQNSHSLCGSVDIDTSLKSEYPTGPRWDYVVASKTGSPRKEKLFWIEIHPAGNNQNIREIQAKANWLKSWLKTKAKILRKYERDFLWVASGKSSFKSNSPQLRILAQAGVAFKGRYYVVPG